MPQADCGGEIIVVHTYGPGDSFGEQARGKFRTISEGHVFIVKHIVCETLYERFVAHCFT